MKLFTIAKAVTVSTILSVLVIPTSAQATTDDLVVIGDSISANYNNTKGSSKRAWWSYLAYNRDMTPRVYAVAGTGYNLRNQCDPASPTFYDRINTAYISAIINQARQIIVAGGVNDFRECNENGVMVTADPATRAAAIDRTLTRLDQLIWNNSRVIITAPWGPAANRSAAMEDTTKQLWRGAKARGFKYINTSSGTLNSSNTYDGVHPTLEGSKAIYYTLRPHSF